MGYIQNKLESYRRKQTIKILTKDLGRIEETEDTIYCYVDEKKFKSKCDYNNIYGFNLVHNQVYVKGEIYTVQKNIVYIFDGIFFDKPLSFLISSKSHNCIKFQNCTFTRYVSINEAENVEFINNGSSTYKISFFAKGKENVKNIEFTNDYTLSGFADSTFIDINCETLKMNNTEFHSDEPRINIKNLIMNDSRIYGGEKIEIDADKISLTDSEIYSSFEIKLNTKECNDFSGVKAHNITYNGLSLFKYNNSYEYIDKLLEERQKLVDTLATIKVAEEQYQREEVSKYRKELKNSPLTRRLKK